MPDYVVGPFKRKDLKIVDADGRAIASVRVSNVSGKSQTTSTSAK